MDQYPRYFCFKGHEHIYDLFVLVCQGTKVLTSSEITSLITGNDRNVIIIHWLICSNINNDDIMIIIPVRPFNQ